jgi:[ribosomal protein S18]-alanine N-acetyltransferase
MALKDVPRVREIDVASFSLPWPERSFRFEITDNPASRLWVAEIIDSQGHSQVVGMIVMWLILDEAHIGTFAIHPDYRRKGIGKDLLIESLLEAFATGVRLCYLEVRRSNLAAQSLYEKFGFQITSVRPHYYRDNGEDAMLMTLNSIDVDLLRTLRTSTHTEINGEVENKEMSNGSRGSTQKNRR